MDLRMANVPRVLVDTMGNELNSFHGCEWQHYRTTFQVCRWFLPKTFVSGPTLTGRDESSRLLEKGGGGCSRQFKGRFKLAKGYPKAGNISWFYSSFLRSMCHPIMCIFLQGISCLSNGFASHQPRVQQFSVLRIGPSVEDDGRTILETPLSKGHDPTPVYYFHLIYFMSLHDTA